MCVICDISFDHPRSAVVWPNFGHVVCLFVCQTITFKSLDVRSSYLHTRGLGIRVKFAYEGHRVKVKVTGGKKVENSLFPQC